MDQYGDIQQSFGRCLRENPNFVEDFYRRLLSSHEKIPPMFTHTDWQLQNKLIRRGISMAITYAGTPMAARRQIADIAKVHSREGHTPVEPSLYPYWIRSLVETVAESDPRYTPKLGRRWEEALKPAIEMIISQY
ncbi:hemoglobin-like flavoprotein [Natronospira proteinivora]|uniref:Hemoglobin-like flavoprotein n=1 Tax=Natronospira proteinivora TaxID=1807133 RepID=A0ABT1G8V8_9GAMM|nr:globin [Natronospira proteinivora]MCP1727754.1 hemoglobin-like flavoprotein [Natronospira proteinivora]